jgi:hypothetical protein
LIATNRHTQRPVQRSPKVLPPHLNPSRLHLAYSPVRVDSPGATLLRDRR